MKVWLTSTESAFNKYLCFQGVTIIYKSYLTPHSLVNNVFTPTAVAKK